MSYAITIIEGFVARDPEMRYTQSGVAVCSTSIPVTEKWTDKDGKKQEKTTWYKITLWNTQAETFNKWVKKGSGILVQGKMQEAKAYLDKSGQPAAQLELKVDTWSFSSAKKADGESNGNHSDGPIHVENGQEFSLISPEEAEKVQW